MTMQQRAGSLVLAVAAFAMACADPAGLDRTLLPGAPTLDVSVTPGVINTLLAGDLAFPGRVRVCKSTPAGDPALTWTFSIQVTGLIGGAAPAPTWDGSITGVSGQTVCETAYTSVKPGDGLDQVIITELALPANWALDHLHIQRFMHGAGPYTPPVGTPLDAGNLTTRVATLFINGDMLRDATFENNFTAPPPPPICTYTKGWYQNNNGKPTVIAVDGRTIAQAQAIFEASPGQPGGVTWGVGALTDNKPNNLLNLYQQFLAALQNLGGDANEDNGPTAVDNAIDAVQAATGGTGLHISLVAGTDVSALINVLSAFNQGEFAGFPHCPDGDAEGN